MELLIVVAVLATLLALAAPSMYSLLQTARMRSEAAKLLDAVQLARSEAASRQQPVSLCPAGEDAGPVLTCAGSYTGGWLVIDGLPPADGRVQADSLLRRYPPVATGYRIATSQGRDAVAPFSYYPDGATRRNLTLSVCSLAEPEAPGWSLVVNRAGRARVARDWGRCHAS
ncbi:GspH/FimT family pseudopilin [Parahaliea mediterranea]|uniref:GspH/FimT family pseudopilin n=1 Tax=Parahaliea mediterranea TaxID=651086 RepID=UPI0013007533|nr:GspH/FimT family pseudopilin [Parahaliea mediterranea]